MIKERNKQTAKTLASKQSTKTRREIARILANMQARNHAKIRKVIKLEGKKGINPVKGIQVTKNKESRQSKA